MLPVANLYQGKGLSIKPTVFFHKLALALDCDNKEQNGAELSFMFVYFVQNVFQRCIVPKASTVL